MNGKIKNNSKKMMLLVMIIMFVFVITGVTYAFFSYSRTGVSNNLTSGYIEFSMLDGESVLLTNEFPESDEEGNKNNPYKFTVNNTSSEGFTVYYNIGLVPNNEGKDKVFTNDQIKYSLIKNGEYVVGSSTSGKYISDSPGLTMGRSDGEGVVLSNQAITAKSTDTYELRIWIADTVDYSNIIDEDTGLSVGYFNDYTYSTKVKINASSHGFAYEEVEEEVPEGYIRLNLYYPSNAINRKWRLDNGEIRTGENGTDWEDYTGPILVKVSDVENIYIKYTISGKEVIVAPTGRVAVDIVPASYKIPEDYVTKVVINYDENATLKQYSIDGGAWQDYNGEFYVKANTLVEAKASKNENIYDSDGNLLSSNLITNYDSVYISEYIPDSSSGESGSSGVFVPPKDVYLIGGEGAPAKYYGGGTISKPDSTSYSLAGPAINPDTTDYVESVMVTIETPDNSTSLLRKNVSATVKRITNNLVRTANSSERIYYKVGSRDVWREYSEPFEVTSNTEIFSYYIDTDGTKSGVSAKRIENIKKAGKPYLIGNVTYNGDKAIVTFNGSDYDTLEYSLDDNYYQAYTGNITLDGSAVVYGRATNEKGTTYYNVNVELSNILEREDLNVGIVSSVNPDNLYGGITGSTDITINFDERATTKLYKLGKNGNWVEYTGKFTLEKNTTIYAYAESDTGVGNANLTIDFLTLGINDPIFKPSLDNSIEASSVVMNIEYDNTAELKQYSIDGGEWIDYTEPFEVTKNCLIEAKSSNDLYESSNEYRVTNIVNVPQFVVIERDGYYLIKLNYPSTSTPATREYKFKDNEWTNYSSEGILLVVPEYKDKILANPNNIKIVNENGKEVVFNGDYYLLDIPLASLMENLYMRWDTNKLGGPTFTKSTDKPTKMVSVSISYDDASVNKLYKVVNPDGTSSDWINYTKPINVFEKGTIIYAKSQDSSEVFSDTSSIIINNIDFVAPTITVNGDFETPKKIVNVQIDASDDQLLSEVYYAKGKHSLSSVIGNGKRITAGATVSIEENGIYTLYAIDYAGNEVIDYFEVTNIDDSAPNIYIMPLTEEYGTEVTFEIEYGDSVTKQYKVGENGTWVNYTESFTLSSYDVYQLANEDFSLTLYAKGIDSVGNETIISEKIYNLDLDMPSTPVINSSSGYPLLTADGVELDSSVSITFDSRNDIINYYSYDGGETWNIYTKSFTPPASAANIMVKSVKKTSGLTVISEGTIGVPSDALPPLAYDGDWDTNTGNFKTTYYMMIDPELAGLRYKIKFYGPNAVYLRIDYLDENGEVISNNLLANTSTGGYSASGTPELVIPEGTKKIAVVGGGYGVSVYEIEMIDMPYITSNGRYPVITEDGVRLTVDISYMPNSVQKLYKIGDGEWQEYTGTLTYDPNKTLVARAIDEDGNITEYDGANVTLPSDAIPFVGYDGDTSTSIRTMASKLIMIDENLSGRQVNIVGYLQGSSGAESYSRMSLVFKDENGTTLSSTTFTRKNYGASLNRNFDIPEGATRLYITNKNDGGYYAYLYEVNIAPTE